MKASTEHHEQVAFVAWFRHNYPDVRIFAIPNGGMRGKIVAMKLKAEGVSRGVPDLFVPEWKLWIEMKKANGGYPTTEQKGWIDYLNNNGYHAVVAHGCEHAKEIIFNYLK